MRSLGFLLLSLGIHGMLLGVLLQPLPDDFHMQNGSPLRGEVLFRVPSAPETEKGTPETPKALGSPEAPQPRDSSPASPSRALQDSRTSFPEISREQSSPKKNGASSGAVSQTTASPWPESPSSSGAGEQNLSKPSPETLSPRSPSPELQASKESALPPESTSGTSSLSEMLREKSRNSSPEAAADSGGSRSETPWHATPLQAPEPAYPKIARKLRREGEVLLEIRIAPSGKVGGVTVLEPCRWQELNEAAREGLSRWEFAPPGRTVTLRVPVIFSLED